MKKNILKYIILGTFTVSVLSTSIFQTLTFAQNTVNTISVKYNKLLKPAKSVINKNGTIMIEASELANVLDGKFSSSEIFNTVSIKISNEEFVAYNNSTKATFKDNELKMPIKAEVIDKKTYLPAKFVANTFGYDVSWNTQKKEVSIVNKNIDYIVLPKIFEVKDSISFEKALEMALQNNSNLKNLNDTYEYLKSVRKKIGENLAQQDPSNLAQNTFPLDGSSPLTNPNSAEYIENSLAILRNIKSTDNQLKNQELNKEIIKDTVELSLLSSVVAIRTTELNILSLQKLVDINEINIKNLESKVNFGFASKKELDMAKNTQSNNIKELDNLKENLINQKENLKSILGTQKDLNVDILLNFNYNDVEKINLEEYIKKAIYTDLSIKMIENEVSVAEYNLKTNAFSTSDNREKFQNELNSAQRRLKDARVNLEKKIRANYSTLKNLKNKEEVLQNNLNTAINEYNVAVSNYKYGKNTVYQVEQAKNSILNAEKSIEENKLNFINTIYTFYKPYLL